MMHVTFQDDSSWMSEPLPLIFVLALTKAKARVNKLSWASLAIATMTVALNFQVKDVDNKDT
jgi:hypothetical protein